MVYDPRLHHRRSIRLRGYDYAGGGAYFITICTEAKKCLFGEIIEGEMFLNEAGRLVQKTWDSLPGRFRTLVLDAFQIMPNHLHGVFVLPGPGLEPALAKATGAPVIQPYEDRRGRACPTLVGGRHGPQGTASRPPTSGNATSGPRRTSMGEVVGAFKSISTIAVNKLLSRVGTRLLHENFYEHIVRDVDELEIIRDYIIHNPQRWLEDPENPQSATYTDWL
jgi:REP element-mobilizing transposase RayT